MYIYTSEGNISSWLQDTSRTVREEHSPRVCARGIKDTTTKSVQHWLYISLTLGSSARRFFCSSSFSSFLRHPISTGRLHYESVLINAHQVFMTCSSKTSAADCHQGRVQWELREKTVLAAHRWGHYYWDWVDAGCIAGWLTVVELWGDFRSDSVESVSSEKLKGARKIM